MRLFRNHYQNPRYRIFFYHDWDVRYEMNGDMPWIMLAYLMPKFERDLFPGDSQLSKALTDFIEEAELNFSPEEYLKEIEHYQESLLLKEIEFNLERMLENVFQ